MKTVLHLLAALLICCGGLAWPAAADPLQVTVAPTGAGTLTLSQTATDQVTLSATPSDGYYFSGFSGWFGEASQTDAPLALALTANFTPLEGNGAALGTLSVSPGLLAASGGTGGPFTPSAFSYTLRNTGSSAIQWSAGTTTPWLLLSAAGGTLAPGGGTVVTVSLNGNAARLAAGYYSATLRFANLSNSLGDTARSASLVVADCPQDINIVTSGAGFSAALTVDVGASVLWIWSDGTMSTSPAPSKDFGSAGIRMHRLAVSPWSALKRINLGYDAADGGDPALARLAPQQVVAVAGLEHAAASLQKWCSSYVPIAALNFDNFINLDTIECYRCSALTQVTLRNTPKLSRACFEESQLGALDLSESPSLADLRGAANLYQGIDFGTVGARLWHLCTRDNQFTRSLPPMTQFPQIQEILIWNNGQTGSLVTSSTQLTGVLASHNSYTSADFSGGFSAGNGWLDVSDNKLTSLKLARCPGLIDVYAGNNRLPGAAVDSVLETLDTLGRIGGYLDLQGNSPPSEAGLLHADSLRKKGWNLYLATQEAARELPGSISFTTEQESVALEVQVTGNPTLTWHWSDGTTDSSHTAVHSFPDPGHRVHHLTVEPASALTYFGAPYTVTQQGLSSVSGHCAYPNLSFLYLQGESLTSLDVTGCAALRDLHLVGNPNLPAAALDKLFSDLDALGGYGGTFVYPAGAATQASAAPRANLQQKGWNLSGL